MFFYYSRAKNVLFGELGETSFPANMADCESDDAELDTFLRRRRVVKSKGNGVLSIFIRYANNLYTKLYLCIVNLMKFVCIYI